MVVFVAMTNALRRDMERRFSQTKGLVTVATRDDTRNVVMKLKSNLTKSVFVEKTNLLLVDVEVLSDDSFVAELMQIASFVVVDECLLCLQWCGFRPVVLRALALASAAQHAVLMSATLPLQARRSLMCLTSTSEAVAIVATGYVAPLIERMNRVELNVYFLNNNNNNNNNNNDNNNNNTPNESIHAANRCSVRASQA